MSKHFWYFLIGFDTVMLTVGAAALLIIIVQGILWLSQHFVLGLGVIGILILMYVLGWLVNRVGWVKM